MPLILLLAFISLLVPGLPLWAEDAASTKVFSKTYVTEKSVIYSEVGDFGEAVARLSAGVEVDVLEYSTNNQWVLVRSPKGRLGWIKKSHTSLVGRRGKPVVKNDPDTKFKPSEKIDLKSFEFKHKWNTLFSLGYANLISLSALHGFDLGTNINYFFSDLFSIGPVISWARFSKSVDGAQVPDSRITRTSQMLFGGVVLRFQQEGLAFELNLGMESFTNQVSAVDSISGTALNLSSVGCSAVDTGSFQAVSVGGGPRFRFPFGTMSVLEIFANWGASFHGNRKFSCDLEATTPQKISAGLATQLIF